MLKCSHRQIFKEDTYISEYPLTMGCKVKSVAMAAAASNVMVADHKTLQADRGNIILILSTQYLESSRSVCFLETVSRVEILLV